MSMTSYRNSETPWGYYVMGDGKLEPAQEITRHVNLLGHLGTRNVYKVMVYYSRYYCENADPIWETARRGMMFS